MCGLLVSEWRCAAVAAQNENLWVWPSQKRIIALLCVHANGERNYGRAAYL